VVAVAAIVTLTAACGPPPRKPAERGPQPLTVGVEATLSGPGALAGADALRGAQLAAAQEDAAGGVDGRPVRVVEADDGGRQSQVRRSMSRLLSARPLAVIGPLDPGRSAEAAALARRAGLPFLGLAPGATAGAGPELTWTSSQLAAVDSDEVVAVLHARRVALVEDPSSSAAAVASDLVGLLGPAGVSVGTPIVLPASGDAGPALSVAAAGRPDLVVIAAAADRAGALVTAAGTAGVGGRCLLVAAPPPPPATRAASGADHCLGGGVPPLASLPGGPRYAAAYTARYHQPPGPWGAFAADAVTLVADAARQGAVSRVQLAGALASAAGASGITGDLSLDGATGERRLPPVAVLDLDAAGVTGVDPAWLAFAAWPPASAN
jgi:branched-chain amino acid transport system substrate-binding protein